MDFPGFLIKSSCNMTNPIEKMWTASPNGFADGWSVKFFTISEPFLNHNNFFVAQYFWPILGLESYSPPAVYCGDKRNYQLAKQQREHLEKQHLVCGFNPSGKIWKSVGLLFPIYGKIKKNVPNHQPDTIETRKKQICTRKNHIGWSRGWTVAPFECSQRCCAAHARPLPPGFLKRSRGRPIVGISMLLGINEAALASGLSRFWMKSECILIISNMKVSSIGA